MSLLPFQNEDFYRSNSYLLQLNLKQILHRMQFQDRNREKICSKFQLFSTEDSKQKLIREQEERHVLYKVRHIEAEKSMSFLLNAFSVT